MPHPINPINPARRWRSPPAPPPIEVVRQIPMGSDSIQPSLPESYGPARGTPVRLPAGNFAPDGSVSVDEMGDANIAPGGAAVLITITIPDQLRFHIDGIGFGADDEVALGFLTWAIQESGVGVPGYTAKSSAVGSIRNLTKMDLLFGASQPITVVASSSATAVLTYRFICRVRGWFFAVKEVA